MAGTSAARSGIEAYFLTADWAAADTGNVPVLGVAAIATAIYEIFSFFEDLFDGGGSDKLPHQLLYRRHPIYGQILGISDGLLPTEASAANPGRPLTDCEKCALAPYIPQADLDSARLHTNGVPSFTPSNKIGITLYNDIYFRPGVYDPSSPEGLALLGHELVHVGQFRNGMNYVTYFLPWWKHEAPAEALQDEINADLTKKGSACCCK